VVDKFTDDESCTGSKYGGACSKNQGSVPEPSARVITRPTYGTEQQKNSASAGQSRERSVSCRSPSERFFNPQSIPTGKRHSARPRCLLNTKHVGRDFQKPTVNAIRRGSRDADFCADLAGEDP
jgi:hypothetical protein